MTPEDAKRLVARAACDQLPERGVIGLGSGSTAKLFIEEVSRLVRAGRQLVGVPTSEGSKAQAMSLGIPLLPEEGPWDVAVTVDGADEVDERLCLIKGGGGALVREKIVNFASRRNVIIVDSTKLSRRLGEKWPVPVEVLRFGYLETHRRLEAIGRPALRERNGGPWVTDQGNFIYDVRVDPIEEPARLDAALRTIPGVVETGLFVDRADLVLVAGDDGGIRTFSR